MKYVAYALLILLCVLVLLLLIAVIRTLLYPRRKADYTPKPDPAREQLYAEKLAAMVRCPTISHSDREVFLQLHRVMEELFPLVHKHLDKTELEGNLLFHWKGKSAERPILLMAHQDVVPAEGEWKHPPFSGEIIDGEVWGRGTGDTKCSLMAFFQATEELLEEGFTPDQDVYLFSTCDEEVSGGGATILVEELKRRGVRPWLVCDEGGSIISEPVGGVKGNYAMVGVFEKGMANVKFTARSNGGHSSAPPRQYPVTKLAAFVDYVNNHYPFRKKFLPHVKAMFSTLAPYAGFPLRLVFHNLWLFAPLLGALMPYISSQATAMLRTTIAFTMQTGSEACNIIPQEATVSANLRFIPHQGRDESLKIICDLAAKYGLESQVMQSSDYSAPVDIHGEQWNRVVDSIHRTFPGLPAVPYVVTGGTDARFLQEICDNCIRFSPVMFSPEQLKGMHGLNETISTNCLPGAVDFFKNLIR